jgi:uncharacterized membrane protein YdbT with pleckstrin-like domain
MESNLLEHEKIVYCVRPHWVVFASGAWAMFFAVVIWFFAPYELGIAIYGTWTLRDLGAGILFVIGAYWYVRAYIYFKTSEYGVTNKRVLIKVGWIERTSLELLLDKVEGVLVDQTILGRIFNYGSINVIGTGGTNDRFPFIPDPQLFRKNVQQQIEIYEESMHR